MIAYLHPRGLVRTLHHRIHGRICVRKSAGNLSEEHDIVCHSDISRIARLSRAKNWLRRTNNRSLWGVRKLRCLLHLAPLYWKHKSQDGRVLPNVKRSIWGSARDHLSKWRNTLLTSMVLNDESFDKGDAHFIFWHLMLCSFWRPQNHHGG